MVFMQGSASKYSTDWPANKGFKEDWIKTWPSCSPDSDPTENLALLYSWVYTQGKQYTSLSSIWATVLAASTETGQWTNKQTEILWIPKNTKVAKLAYTVNAQEFVLVNLWSGQFSFTSPVLHTGGKWVYAGSDSSDGETGLDNWVRMENHSLDYVQNICVAAQKGIFTIFILCLASILNTLV